MMRQDSSVAASNPALNLLEKSVRETNVLRDHRVYATIPTADVDRLRRFYEDTLGFPVVEETPGGIFFGAADGTVFAVTRQSGSASGTHTQMGIRVQGIEGEVADLRRRGVRFEEYAAPRTVDGIADVPVGKAAWFKDPDGNLIGMVQFAGA
jgi:catechol 2,3-dioxygenase-like lactoylglutathione lyase family enzyme